MTKKVKPYYAGFTGGELDPEAWGRVDLKTYSKAVAKARNVYIDSRGSLQKRGGLKDVDGTTTNQQGRLIDFEFNDEQDYLLVFTPGEFKVYREVAGVDTLQATVTTAVIAALTAAQIDEMTWTQSADTLLLFHKDVQTITITRTSHTAWTAVATTFSNIPQFDFGSGNEDVISATRGWPVSGTFGHGRLWLGLGSRPQTILGSKVNDFFNLDVGTALDNEAIDYTLNTDKVNAIRHVFFGRDLQVYTKGGEWYVRSSLGDPITPTKFPTQIHSATSHGSAAVPPISVDGETLFVENGANVVRQFIFNELEDSFNAPEVSDTATHLILCPARMAIGKSLQKHRADYAYLVNNDGTMAVLNVLREEKILGWSLFTTNGTIEDIVVVGRKPYCIVKRTINSVEVRRIEKIDPDHLLDASKKATSGSPTTSWTGFSHLDGETVKVIGDSFVLSNAAVSGGAFTSSKAVSAIEAGLLYVPEVETLPITAEINGQIALGDYTSIYSVLLYLYKTRDALVKKDGITYKLSFNQFGAILDAAPEFFSGWKETFVGGIQRESQLTVTQEEPLEFTLRSMKFGLEV